jgi:uncharacterized protein YndB with AHSA1/START domain
MRIGMLTGAVCGLLPLAAAAEVRFAAADGMLIVHEYRIAAPAAKAWESLVHPERWWPEDHTWSGTRASLSLEAKAGACFCERWQGGSAEHGRVIMAQPWQLLRLRASLGPLQEMAVAGVLTIQLNELEGVTTATVSYRVSGDPAHKLDGLAPIVDQVIGAQFGEFAEDAVTR